jgi:Xaa-Pro aminopeptidase
MLYGFVVAYHKRLLALIEPDRTPAAIMAEAAEQMRVVCDNTEWPKAIYRQGAERMLAWQGHFSHPVGMAVHDVGRYREDTLKPGLVFALDPSLWIPEERLYYRVEDTLLITEAGYENLTADAPLALDQVEATVGKGGLVQRYPPLD